MPTPQEVQRAEQRRRLEAQRRLPTPAISPLPLPQINQTLRNVVAGSPAAVNPVAALTQQAQQVMQQFIANRNKALAASPGSAQPEIPRQLTPAEVLRNVTAGGRLPEVAGPPTLPVGRADPRRGRGTGVTRPPVLSSVSPPGGILSTTQRPSEFFQASQPAAGLLESGLRPSEFFGFSQPRTPEEQALSLARQFNAQDTLNTIEAAAGHVFVSMSNNARPPFILFGVQERLGWTDQQMIDAGYERALGGWVRKPVTGRISNTVPLTTASGGTTFKFPSFGGGSGRTTRPGSGLVNWRI